ncbi:hypothetical protein B296_00041535 [Ensete ventricosum]|uniref:Uncharacterized protein n=1 Tax=Ensete ventricosum TaxID=4639 RepID=A0A426XZ57_ENSVE|nr:hypothetical protein B296_00041535 [Ensete ventricosum]
MSGSSSRSPYEMAWPYDEGDLCHEDLGTSYQLKNRITSDCFFLHSSDTYLYAPELRSGVKVGFAPMEAAGIKCERGVSVKNQSRRIVQVRSRDAADGLSPTEL